MGLTFKNPVGLAAGFDKDASYVKCMSNLGFGFIEVGTVTPVPQEGNEKPRLFRLPDDSALINRMGFNNAGVDIMVSRLKKLRKSEIIIGGNIGKNKVTPNDESVRDYEICFEKIFPYVDYFVINVSSPNTPGLRQLQEKEPLDKLLGRLQILNNQNSKPKPLLLKIAPDLNFHQLDDILEVVGKHKLSGIIATNTSLDRSLLKTKKSRLEGIGAGGLSGIPVAERSNEIIKYIRSKVDDNFTIIGVGGVHSAEDALDKLNSGANLVQVFTGLIYEGPGLIKSINRQLAS